jgi:hypothetical protein
MEVWGGQDVLLVRGRMADHILTHVAAQRTSHHLTHVTQCTSHHPNQVWDFTASADARDTEGGASKRSLLQQVQKMRDYLAV